MRMSIRARLKKLDAAFALSLPKPVFRCGWIERLPKDFSGERHVAGVSRPPDKSPPREPWEFEERPGRGPVGGWRGFTVFLTR